MYSTLKEVLGKSVSHTTWAKHSARHVELQYTVEVKLELTSVCHVDLGALS